MEKSVSFAPVNSIIPPVALQTSQFYSTQPPEPSRRKAGRPSKNPPRPVPINRGIVPAPLEPNNRMELYFQNAYIFRQLSIIAKSMGVIEIQLHFKKTEIYCCIVHPNGDSVLFLNINVAHVISYYCEEEDIVVGIKQSRLESVFQSNSKKNMLPVLFKLSKDNKNILLISIEETEFFTRDITTLEIITTAKLHPTLSKEPDINTYALSMTMTSEMLKNFISLSKSTSVMLNVDKIEGSPLTMSLWMGKIQMKVKEFTDDVKISLKSNGDYAISAAIPLENIKPIIMACLSPFVNIYVDNSQFLAFNYSTDVFSMRHYIKLTSVSG